MSEKLKGIIAILSFILVLTIIIWSISIALDTNKEVLKNGERCACEIIKHTSLGAKAQVTFSSGKRRVIPISHTKTFRLKPGDKYYCKYLGKYPKKVLLLYDEEYKEE